jgi:hypothetical protein
MTRFNPETILALTREDDDSWKMAKNRFEIIEICQEEIYSNAAKMKGGNALLRRFNAAKKYIKGIDDNRPALKGAWYEPYGVHERCQAFCNGYTALFLYEPLQGLPEPSVQEEQLLKVRAVLVGIPSNYEKVENVNLVEAVVMTKTNKRGDDHPIFGLGNQNFDPWLLLETANILGDKIDFWQDPIEGICPMYLTNDNGIAIVLPLRK